jgi:hypothetical protein
VGSTNSASGHLKNVEKPSKHSKRSVESLTRGAEELPSSNGILRAATGPSITAYSNTTSATRTKGV